MVDEYSEKDAGWPALRSEWREREQQIRAPRALLDGVLEDIDRQQANKRFVRFGIAVAMLVAVLTTVWFAYVPERVEPPLAQLAATQQEPDPWLAAGPCAVSGSCLDVRSRLAQLDLGTAADLADAPPVSGNRGRTEISP